MNPPPSFLFFACDAVRGPPLEWMVCPERQGYAGAAGLGGHMCHGMAC